jgi:hypothetical protein
VLLTKQPFYIGGIDDYAKAKDSAFGAAGTFFVVFVVSMVLTIKEGRRLDQLTRSRIPNDSNGNNSTNGRRDGYAGVFRDTSENGEEVELHMEFSDNLRVEHVEFQDDPLWDNPLPTNRPYRDDPTFT